MEKPQRHKDLKPEAQAKDFACASGFKSLCLCGFLFRRCHALAVASALIASLGCSKFVPVEGAVTLDGTPVVDATVSFMPVGSGRQATALTGPDGRFQLSTTNKLGDGAIPGTYKVSVRKFDVKAAPTDPKRSEKMTGSEGFGMNSPRRPLLPKPYLSSSTTPIQVEIPKTGTRDLEIKLSSKP